MVKWGFNLRALSRALHLSKLLQEIFKNFQEPLKLESRRGCVMLHPSNSIPSDESLDCTSSTLVHCASKLQLVGKKYELIDGRL